MSILQSPAVPAGSTVLVTGVNGFIGSHVADKFLAAGYKVRGTVRDPAKHQWIVELFEKKHGVSRFELVTVKDMASEGAYNGAVKGVSVVAHVASPVSFEPDPNIVVATAISGAMSALKAAAEEPSVKRFVLTSSSAAVLTPVPDQDITVDENTWNESAVKEAWKDPPYEPSRGFFTYAASKTQAEQEVWKWYRENKPDLVVNVVAPNANFGQVLDVKHQGYPSSAGMVMALYNDAAYIFKDLPPQWYIDVEDDALLHVAAAIHPDVKDERIFGFAEPYTYNQILAIMRRLYPDRKFMEDFHKGQDLTKIIPRDRAERLLKDLGRPGWTSLEESIKRTVESPA